MANLTKQGRQYILNILKNEETNLQPSNILSSPGYEENNNPQFLWQMLKKILPSRRNWSGWSDQLFYDIIIKNFYKRKEFQFTALFFYKNYKIFFLCMDQAHLPHYGFIGIFNKNNELIYLVDKVETLLKLEKMRPIKWAYVSNEGEIFVLHYAETGGIGVGPAKTTRVFFTRYAHFLPEIENYIKNENLKIFADFNFEISKEKTTDKDGNPLNPKFGNVNFLDYDKLGFSKDVADRNKFAFVLWKKTTQKIELIIFTHLDNNEVEFETNEEINLTQGDNLATTNFSDASIVTVAIGEQEINNEKNLGSIIFSGTKASTQKNTIPIHKNLKWNVPIEINWLYTLNPWKTWTYGVENKIYTATKTINLTEYFKAILQPIVNLINQPEIKTKNLTWKLWSVGAYNNANVEWNSVINQGIIIGDKKNYLNLLLTSDRIDLKMTMKMFLSDRAKKRGENYLTEVCFEPNIEILGIKSGRFLEPGWISNLDNQSQIKCFKYPDIRSVQSLGTVWDFGTWGSSHKLGEINASGRNRFNLNFQITFSGEREQFTLKDGTASQIIISRKNDRNIYKIFQIENNIYSGTKPIFISPLRVLIPLIKRRDNEFSIFEFNGKLDQKKQETTRFYNTIADRSGTIVFILLKPNNIIKVSKNDIVLSSANYQFEKSKNIITISNLNINDRIIIEYRTFIGSPKEIEVFSPEISDKVYISKVENIGEIGTNLPTIIGCGYDRLTKENIIFNLYDNYTKTATINFPLITDFPLTQNEPLPNQKELIRIIGYRQKNIINFFIYTNYFFKEIKAIQVYPESKIPYTFLPYEDTKKALKISRFNVSKTSPNQKINYLFDNRFLDIATTENIIIGNTVASYNDLNQTNKYIQIFGETNHPIFSSPTPIYKIPQEIKEINFNINGLFLIDEIHNKKELSNEIVKLFDPSLNTEKLQLEKVRLIDNQTNLIKEFEIIDFINIVNLEDKGIIKINFKLIRRTSDKIIDKIQILNKLNEIIVEEKIPQHKINDEIIFSKELYVL